MHKWKRHLVLIEWSDSFLRVFVSGQRWVWIVQTPLPSLSLLLIIYYLSWAAVPAIIPEKVRRRKLYFTRTNKNLKVEGKVRYLPPRTEQSTSLHKSATCFIEVMICYVTANFSNLTPRTTERFRKYFDICTYVNLFSLSLSYPYYKEGTRQGVKLLYI